MIKSIQRGIISGLVLETFNPEEVNKRFEICEKLIPGYKHLFTEEQLQILRLVYKESKKYLQNGAVVFGISEITERIIAKKYPHLVEEMLEILCTGPLIEEMIPIYLKELENQMLEI